MHVEWLTFTLAGIAAAAPAYERVALPKSAFEQAELTAEQEYLDGDGEPAALNGSNTSAVTDNIDGNAGNETVPEASPITPSEPPLANSTTITPAASAEATESDSGADTNITGGMDDAESDQSTSAPSGNASASDDPCKEACTPRIDVKASVVQAYKRHRAQVAVIGDYGSCSHARDSPNSFSWEVEWGDGEIHDRKLPHMGPYQATHTYAKKGKYDVEVTFCAHTKGCNSGCTTITKKLKVKP